MCKVKKKFLILFLSLAMVLTCSVQSIVYAEGENSEQGDQITVEKNAEWVNTPEAKDDGIAKVTLKVHAKDIEVPVQTVSPVKIVLVLDVSRSMDKNSKLENLKTQAEIFINKMIVNKGIKIGIVKYAETAEKVCDFEDNTKKEDLIKAIKGLELGSGTNIQDGIRKGEDMLSGNSDSKKYMVVLSDGEPNRSYKGTKLEKGTTNLITEFDYNTLLRGPYYPYELNNVWISGHEYGTIGESAIAKKAGINIYSIGFDISSDGAAERVMKGIASTVGNYQLASVEGLDLAFNNIKDSVISKEAGSSVKVDDILGSSSELGKEYNFSLDLLSKIECTPPEGVPKGDYLYNAQTKTFNWELTSSALKGGDYSFTYYIKLNLSELVNEKGKNLENVFSNNKAVLNYLDENGNPQSKTFDNPKLPVTHYTVNYNYSDDNGASYNKKLSNTAVAIVGCSNKVVNEDMITEGERKGYDFVSDLTTYGKDNNKKSLEIKENDEENVINLYYKKYQGKGSADISAKKIFNHKLDSHSFNFILEKSDESCNVFEGKGYEPYIGTNDANGNITFTSIDYDEGDVGKTFYYKMSEVNEKTNNPYIDYSSSYYLVKVHVSDPDHNGKLATEISYFGQNNGEWVPLKGIPTFDNKYNLTGNSVSLKVTKKLEGQELKANQFEFNAIETDKDGNPLPDAKTITAKNDENGDVVFDKVDYSNEQTHYYMITENNGGETVDNITYDNMKVFVQVDVRDKDKGKLECDVIYPEDTEFNNVYNKPKEVVEEEKDEPEIIDEEEKDPAEIVPADDIEKPEIAVKEENKTKPVDTGDENDIILWIGLSLIAALTISAMIIRKKKLNK